MYIYREESLSEKGALNKHFFPITIWKDMYMCIWQFPIFPFVCVHVCVPLYIIIISLQPYAV